LSARCSRATGRADVDKAAAGEFGLFDEVFRKFDAGNRLLGKAEREVLDQEFDMVRPYDAGACAARGPSTRLPARPTPFAFPLVVERLREQVTTEKLSARIECMFAAVEQVAARRGIQDIVASAASSQDLVQKSWGAAHSMQLFSEGKRRCSHAISL